MCVGGSWCDTCSEGAVAIEREKLFFAELSVTLPARKRAWESDDDCSDVACTEPYAVKSSRSKLMPTRRDGNCLNFSIFGKVRDRRLRLLIDSDGWPASLNTLVTSSP
eukprot:6189020-Pleurochrysis_carterae.AAC.1